MTIEIPLYSLLLSVTIGLLVGAIIGVFKRLFFKLDVIHLLVNSRWDAAQAEIKALKIQIEALSEKKVPQ